MASTPSIAVTIPFDRFWSWLQVHPNCILRVGTREIVLFDDDDLHWHFSSEQDGALLVQLMRGKRALGEVLLAPGTVSYVQAAPTETPDEHGFDLFGDGPEPVFQFVMAHSYDPEELGATGRWVH